MPNKTKILVVHTWEERTILDQYYPSLNLYADDVLTITDSCLPSVVEGLRIKSLYIADTVVDLDAGLDKALLQTLDMNYRFRSGGHIYCGYGLSDIPYRQQAY